MRYQMGPIELIGWMILGGFLGVFLNALLMGGVQLIADALKLHLPSLGLGTGLLVFLLSIVTGAMIPVVIHFWGRSKE